MERQQHGQSTHAWFPFVQNHSSLLETAEHIITALGKPPLCVESLPSRSRGSSTIYGNHTSNPILKQHMEMLHPGDSSHVYDGAVINLGL